MSRPANVQSFLDNYANDIIKAVGDSTIFPSVAIAQAGLESGWGKSHPNNNFFGIKAGNGWTGKVSSQTTTEYLDGKKQTIKGTGKIYDNKAKALAAGANKYTIFRVYDSPVDSFRDHNKVLLGSKYAAARAATTPEAQVDGIKAGGYATSPTYADTLKKIITQYNLTEYDSKKKNSRIIIIGLLVAALVAIIVLRKKIFKK